MQSSLIEKNYIPLDKSWIIRMGVLDILGGKTDIIKFLEQQNELADDLQALHKAAISWDTDDSVDVGESGTLYRFLMFASWKFNLNKKFILQGTLEKRKITKDPSIINYPLKKLLELDNQTSQWASASVLSGNEEIIDNPPYKLKLTYDAVEHWNIQRAKNESWIPRYDPTILKQAEVFTDLLGNKKAHFVPEQAEDYCFARAFGFMTKEEGEARWPSLVGHESNRIEEMENVLLGFDEESEIYSKDHRVVQAISMLGKLKNKEVKIKYPHSVDKSWPQFWKFLKNSEQLSL